MVPTSLKACTKCGTPKPEEQFSSNGRWGRHTVCLTCQALYRKSNAEHRRQRLKSRKDKIREFIRDAKRLPDGSPRPCVDCGHPYKHFQMEFDHTRGRKDSCIAAVVNRGWAIGRLDAELQKCDLICVGCHRVRTASRCGPRENAGRTTIRKRQLLETVNKLKTAPCSSCGNTHDPLLMDFDHVDPSTKLFEICRGIQNKMKLSVVLAEIGKCQLLCAWCHAEKTHSAG